MSLPTRNSEELFWIAGLDLAVLFPSPLMGEGWDEGDDSPHLNPLPPGERKLRIKTQLTCSLQEILKDGGLIPHVRKELGKGMIAFRALDNPYLQC